LTAYSHRHRLQWQRENDQPSTSAKADKATIELTDAASVDDLAGDNLVFSVSAGSAKIQTGANEGDTLSISIGNMTPQRSAWQPPISALRPARARPSTDIQQAINTVSTQRANLGAVQNRLDHKICNLDTSSENLSAAESRIRDVDMAKEMTEYTKTSILVQAATSMLAQANSAPQNVLSLLQ
jgi:flagellin